MYIVIVHIYATERERERERGREEERERERKRESTSLLPTEAPTRALVGASVGMLLALVRVQHGVCESVAICVIPHPLYVANQKFVL